MSNFVSEPCTTNITPKFFSVKVYYFHRLDMYCILIVRANIGGATFIFFVFHVSFVFTVLCISSQTIVELKLLIC